MWYWQLFMYQLVSKWVPHCPLLCPRKISPKPPLIMRPNLVLSGWACGLGSGPEVVAGSCCSPPSFLPSRLFSPKKLLTEDAIPRCAPIALLRLSSVPPDRSRPMISIASLCAGSRASGSFNKFCIDGRSRSRTLLEGRSAITKAKKYNKNRQNLNG